jgi:hypothetical protein
MDGVNNHYSTSWSSPSCYWTSRTKAAEQASPLHIHVCRQWDGRCRVICKRGLTLNKRMIKLDYIIVDRERGNYKTYASPCCFSALAMASAIPMTASSSWVRPTTCSPTGAFLNFTGSSIFNFSVHYLKPASLNSHLTHSINGFVIFAEKFVSGLYWITSWIDLGHRKCTRGVIKSIPNKGIDSMPERRSVIKKDWNHRV